MVLCLKEDQEPQSQENPLKKENKDPIDMWKKMIGPMNPEDAKKSDPESLRAKYGKSIVKN